MQGYEHVCFLGQGAYGNVALCRLRTGFGPESQQYVALKTLRAAHLDSKVMRLTLREIGVLRMLGGAHPNIVRLLQAFKAPSGRVCLVFEYYGKSAATLLGDRFPFGVPPLQFKRLAFQLVQALRYLHSRKVLHRDIKPANILVNADGVCRLCDFGFARLDLEPATARTGERLTPYVVTRWYRAPEVLLGMSYGAPADIWSLGCTLAELATGEPLLPGDSSLDQLARIVRTTGPLPPRMAACLNPQLRDSPALAAAAAAAAASTTDAKAVPPALRQRLGAAAGSPLLELLAACLRPDPRDRPTAEQLLALPYFADISAALAGTPLENLYDASASWMTAPMPQRKRAVAPAAAAGVQGSSGGADAGGSCGGGSSNGGGQGTQSSAAAADSAHSRPEASLPPLRATADEDDLPVIPFADSASPSGLPPSPDRLHRYRRRDTGAGMAALPVAVSPSDGISCEASVAGIRGLRFVDVGACSGSDRSLAVRASRCRAAPLSRFCVSAAALRRGVDDGADDGVGSGAGEDLPSQLFGTDDPAGRGANPGHSSAPHMHVHMPARSRTTPGMRPAPAAVAGSIGRHSRRRPSDRVVPHAPVLILEPSPSFDGEPVACGGFSGAGSANACDAFPRFGGGSACRGIAWPPTVGAAFGGSPAEGGAGASGLGLTLPGAPSPFSVGAWLDGSGGGDVAHRQPLASYPLQAPAQSAGRPSLRSAVLGAGGAAPAAAAAGAGLGGMGVGLGGLEQAEAAGEARPLAKVHMRTSLESYIRQLQPPAAEPLTTLPGLHEHGPCPYSSELWELRDVRQRDLRATGAGPAGGDEPAAQRCAPASSSAGLFALLAEGMAAAAAAAVAAAEAAAEAAVPSGVLLATSPSSVESGLGVGADVGLGRQTELEQRPQLWQHGEPASADQTDADHAGGAVGDGGSRGHSRAPSLGATGQHCVLGLALRHAAGADGARGGPRADEPMSPVSGSAEELACAGTAQERLPLPLPPLPSFVQQRVPPDERAHPPPPQLQRQQEQHTLSPPEPRPQDGQDEQYQLTSAREPDKRPSESEHPLEVLDACEANLVGWQHQQVGWQPQPSVPSVSILSGSAAGTGSVWSRRWSAGGSTSCSMSGSRLASRAQAYGPHSTFLLDGSSHRGSQSGSQHDNSSALILGPGVWRRSNPSRLHSAQVLALRPSGGRASAHGGWDAAAGGGAIAAAAGGGMLFYHGCPMPTAVPPLLCSAAGDEEALPPGRGSACPAAGVGAPRPAASRAGRGPERPLAASWGACDAQRTGLVAHARRGSTGNLAGPLGFGAGEEDPGAQGDVRAGGGERGSGPEAGRELTATLAAVRGARSGSGRRGSLRRRYRVSRSSSGGEGLGGGEAVVSSLGSAGGGNGAAAGSIGSGGLFPPVHLARSGSGSGLLGPQGWRRRASAGPFGAGLRPEATALGPVAEEPRPRRRRRSGATAATLSCADRASDSNDAISGSRTSEATTSGLSSGARSSDSRTPGTEAASAAEQQQIQRQRQHGLQQGLQGHQGSVGLVRGSTARSASGTRLPPASGGEHWDAPGGGDGGGVPQRWPAIALRRWLAALGGCFGM